MNLPSSAQKARLLVIDDNREFLSAMDAFFGREFEIAGFDSGAAFLRNPKLFRPDIIVLDVDMPERDGFSVCRAIRRRKALSRVPVLFLSALEERTEWERWRDAGGDAFLKKPFDLPELRETIRAMLDSRRIRIDPRTGAG